MFKSIRWSLLFWYALILAAVIGGFGATLYVKLERSMLNEVDAELRAHAQAIAGALEGDGERFDLELSDAYVKYFQQAGEDAPYYVIWTAKGGLVDRSNPRETTARPSGTGAWSRGARRELAVTGNAGALVLVGKGVHEADHRLHEFLGIALAAGGAALVLGLAGGWFLTVRALGPIAKITQTASSISASDLSKRIDLVEIESELGTLTQTLNATFDRLQEAFDRQTRFTADASHELRTPLSIVMSQCELALKKDRSAADYRETIQTCLRAAQRMKAVVDGLLTLARADARELNLQKERFDFKPVVEETVSMLRPMADERGVKVSVSAAACEVNGDRDRLREVVANLVANAIRYNRSGGKVDVTLGAGPLLTVADTGVGIPEKDRPQIFERFYRVDKARSREQGGTGLGLAITKWIVEAHGGSISFTSREGEGTTFTVTL